MGLDVVEILFEIEDAFGIEIANEEYTKLTTVGELHTIVTRMLPAPTDGPCLTTIAFNRLRRALTSVFGVPRASVKRDVALCDVMPARSRRKVWARIQRDLAMRLPPLQRPTGIVVGMAIVSAVAGIAAAVVTIDIERQHDLFEAVVTAFLFAVTVGLFTFPATFACTRPFATCIPAVCATIGDTARALLVKNYQALGAEAGAHNEKEQWRVIKTIVSEQLDVPAEKITRDTRFQDLA